MKIFTYFVVVAFCAAQIHAGESQDISESETDFWSVTLTGKYWNKYSLDGVVYADVPVFQTDLWFQHESGFFFNLWNSFGFEGADFDEETDFGLGWNGSLGNFDVSIGAWYFWIEHVYPFTGDMLKPSFDISRTYHFGSRVSVTPFFNYAHYHSFGVVDGGNLIRLGTRRLPEIYPEISGFFGPGTTDFSGHRLMAGLCWNQL